MGERVSTSSSVDYLTDLSTDTQTPIDGHKSTVTGTGGLYLKHHTPIFTYRMIDQPMEGKNGGRDKSVGHQTAGRIDRTDRKDASTGRTVLRIDRTQHQQSQLS